MMTGLFDRTRHEPLQASPWDEAAAREAIRRIADSALAAYEPGRGWRAHPLDDPKPPIDRFHDLYFGAGGVIWALRHLAQNGGRSKRCPISRPLSPRCAKPTGRCSPIVNTAARRTCLVMLGSICCIGP
jgi:hypothetical protein